MKQDIEDEETIRLYLLGKLPAEEQKQLELRLLTDDDYFQWLLVLEAELMDDYANENLSEHERDKAESHFLVSPERQQDLKFAKALSRYAGTSSGVEPSKPDEAQSRLGWMQSLAAALGFQGKALKVALACAVLLVVIGSTWLIFKSRRLENQLEQARAQQAESAARQQQLQQQLAQEQERIRQLSESLVNEQSQRTNLEQDLTDLRVKVQQRPETTSPSNTQGSLAPFIMLALQPGVTRDGEGQKKISIPASVAEVRVQLGLPADDYRSYQAMLLRTDDGQELLSRERLKARALGQGKVVTFSIPAKLLKPDDYQLKLSGVTPNGDSEEVRTYPFRVLQK